MRLYSIGLGIFTRAISSANPDAQAYFNQGFQMMYAFAKPEAIASFREARRRDPSCAICFWGEAWAYGPYLNGAIAIQAAKDYAKLMGDTGFHALTLVRFGRFDEVEAVRTRPVQGLSAGFWDFAQGYARLRMGDTRAAREYLARVREGATSPARFRFHSAADLLGVVGDILEGELERAAGDLPAAIARFERAVITEDGLTYDEPEPLPFAARHWLGAALLEAGRPADAERVYREELDDHPHNGWSLIGLRQALVSQQPTADVDADFASSWARSDTWIRASRF